MDFSWNPPVVSPTRLLELGDTMTTLDDTFEAYFGSKKPLEAARDLTMPTEAEIANPLLEEDDDEEAIALPPSSSPKVISAVSRDRGNLDVGEDLHAPRPSAKQQARVRHAVDAVLDGDFDEAERVAKRLAKPSARRKKYSRKRITDKDMVLMEFLARFKFASAPQLAQLSLTEDGTPVAVKTAHRRLLGLKEAGYVKSGDAIGSRTLWYLTKKGFDTVEAGDNFVSGDGRRINGGALETTQVGHYLATNQVAVQLLTGRQHFFDLAAESVDLWHLMSEYQIDQAWSRWKQNTHARADAPKSVEEKKNHWETAHYIAWRDAKEKQWTKAEHPELWTLGRPHRDATYSGYHHPDLVWLPNGDERRAVALEVEVSVKDPASYQRILRNYKLNTSGYEAVVWICNSRQIAKRLLAAQEAVGLSADFMKVVPLRTFDGQPFLDRAWKLDN